MEISLPPALKDFVQETVKAGLYNNKNEVVSEALQLLQIKEKSLIIP